MFDYVSIKLKAFIKSEEGAESLEYVVIGALVLIAAGAVYNPGINSLLSTGFTAVSDAMTLGPSS